jgi:uncharacterized protein YggE
MKRNVLTIALVTTLLMTFAGNSFAQSTTQPYIDMSTTVEREVTPDELYLRITINEKEYKGKKSLEEMQDAMIDALKACRIDISNCLTLNYMDSEISYKAFSKKVMPKTEATYILKLNDATAMQNVISALEEKQISNISLIRTRYTKEKELKAEMGIEAMQQAKAEAQTLAGAIGQEVGKAITISSWTSGNEQQPRMYKARANALEDSLSSDAPVMPIIQIGKITYRFNVSVRFELR